MKICYNKRINTLVNDDYINIPAFILGLTTLIPSTNLGLIIRTTIIGCIGIYLIFANIDINESMVSVQALKLVMFILLSFVLSVSYGVIRWDKINTSLIYHELLRTLLNVIVIILIMRLSCNFKTLFYVCVCSLLYTVTIAIWQWYEPGTATDWIMKFYVDGEDMPIHLTLPFKTIGAKRSTSIYINPNIFSLFITICFPVVLEACIRKKGKLQILTFILAVVGLVIAGSRTGVVLCVGVFMLFCFRKKLTNRKKVFETFITMIMVGLVAVILLSMIGTGGYRAFNISGGLYDSLSIKINMIVEYLCNHSITEVVFGGIANPVFEGMDSEWGYILSMYGLIGLGWYFSLLCFVLKGNKKPIYVKYSYLMIIVLAAITETVYHCLTISTVYFLFVFSICEDWTDEYEHE